MEGKMDGWMRPGLELGEYKGSEDGRNKGSGRGDCGCYRSVGGIFV